MYEKILTIRLYYIRVEYVNREMVNELIERSGRSRLVMIGILIRVVLITTGLFRGILESRQVQIEYIENNEEIVAEKIVVDIGGGVEMAGVYELSKGSRIKDVLAVAGGLSAMADREYIAKYMNLAETVKDGQKIYVPVLGESTTQAGYADPEKGGKMVNINTATELELDTLEGIGPTRARAIIEGRPYSKTDELIEKKILTKTIFEKIKDRITIY